MLPRGHWIDPTAPAPMIDQLPASVQQSGNFGHGRATIAQQAQCRLLLGAALQH
jgi:hypothetical protein